MRWLTSILVLGGALVTFSAFGARIVDGLQVQNGTNEEVLQSITFTGRCFAAGILASVLDAEGFKLSGVGPVVHQDAIVGVAERWNKSDDYWLLVVRAFDDGRLYRCTMLSGSDWRVLSQE